MLAFIFRASQEFELAGLSAAEIDDLLTQLGLSGNSGTDLVSIKFSVGLWRSCVSVPDNKVCVNGPDPSICSLITGETADVCHKMIAARAFITIACIISGISAVCFFARTLETINQNKMVIMTSMGLAIGSFVAGVIGLALGITATTATGSLPVKVSINAAAILAIIAVVINLIGAVLAVLTR